MDTKVATDKGAIEGVDLGSCIVYKGIPYAKPPVGALRWKAPQETDEWEGVLKADHFRKICPQEPADPKAGGFGKEFYSDPGYEREMSEDCLYLNIWRPKKIQGKIPVAFWIHGGAFSNGYSSELEFDGEAYCRRNIILVTVGYRLNVFGFLAHPWLDAENEKNISGNYGILDQIAALKWVKRNIAAFGGDPENITVFGQSAGGMSTQVLVSSELTENMIAKAVLQSGISCKEEILKTPTLAEEEIYGRKFVEYTGAADIQELRSLSAEKLTEAKRRFDREMRSTGQGLVMVPNVDGYVLKRSVKEVWKNGEMKQIPYMAGAVNQDLGSVPEEVKEKKPGILMEECRRFSFRCEEVYRKPAYLYHFVHDLPGKDEKAFSGAFHSSELWYMFGTLDRCWRPMTDLDRKLSEEMLACWTNFMKTGNPSSEETQPWEPCGRENPFIRTFR